MATLSRFTLVGPLSKQVERTAIQACRNNWWTDVLYISNFVDKEVGELVDNKASTPN